MSGSRADLEVVAEFFELAHEPGFLDIGIVALGVIVGAQVGVFDLIVQDVPHDHQDGVRDRDGCLLSTRLAEPAMEAPKARTQTGFRA
jgi:hypothetical protein